MSTSPAAPAPAPAPAPGSPPTPKRRRWKKILGITGAVLGGLLILAALLVPPVAGAVIRSKVPAALAEALAADVELADASFRWSGRVRLEGLKITPQGFQAPLLEVPRLTAHVGLFSALGGRYLADVDIDAPRIVVERDARGRFNYELPPRPSEPPSGAGASAESSEKPVVRAVVRIRDGALALQHGGQETRFALGADVRLDGLEKPLVASITLADPAGGKITAEAELDLGRIAGPLRLRLERVALANLTPAARAFGNDGTLELGGSLDGSLDYRLDGRAVDGRTELRGSAVAARVQGRLLEIDVLKFAHAGGLDAAGKGRNEARLALGSLVTATIAADVSGAWEAPAAASRLEVDVDLAPAVAWLKASGLLHADLSAEGKVALRGTAGWPPRWDLETSAPAVGITLDGKPIRIEGVSHRSAGALDADGNGRATLRLSSGKALQAAVEAELTALYRAPEVTATLDASSDLAELGRVLEKALGLKAGMALEGTSALRATLTARGEQVRAKLDATTSDLAAIDASKKRIPLDREIRLELDAGWEGKTKTATADALRLTSSFATLDGKGGARVGEQAVALRASTLSLDADLAGLAAKLGAVLETPPALAGKASLRARAEGEAVAVDGAFTGVRFGDYGPLDATLKHEGTVDAKGNGRHVLRLESGRALAADLSAELTDGAVEARFGAESDLGALAAALPGLIELKPGAGLEGKASLSGTASRKGDAASFDLKLEAADLAAVEKKVRTEIDRSMIFAAAGTWDGAKRSLELRALTLRSSLATADAKGGFTLAEPLGVRDSSFALSADLAAIGAKLKLLLEDPPALAGRVEAKGTYAGESYDLAATATQLKVGEAGPIDAVLVQKGALSLAPGGDLEIHAGEVDLPGFSLSLRGAIRKVADPAREGEIGIEVKLSPAELSKWIPDLGLAGEPIPVSAKVTFQPDLVSATGRTEVKALTLGSKTAKARPLTFDVRMKGEDLAAKLRSELVEWAEPAYAAKAGLEADLVYSPKGTSGVTKLVNLEVVDEKKNVVKEPAVTLAHDVGIAGTTVEVRKADVDCGFLRGGLTGRVTAEPRFEGVRGSFRYHPDKLGAVLKPFMPGALSGAEEKTLTFALDGTSLQDAKGTVDVDLPRYTHTGVTVSGKASLAVEKGILRTSSPLDVNRGRTELNAAIDLREAKEKPQSTVDFKAKDVDANADMAPFLSSINPIFHTVNGAVAGKTTADFRLTWTGPIDPATKDWEKAAAPALRGAGRLAVKDLAITGSPAVGLIMQALGEGNELRGELLGTDIQVRDGACHYANMTLRLARYELRFTGWVGFDKKMELTVEMPLTPGMRKRYPNLERYTGQSLKVPLRGTAASPRLDFEKVVENLIKDAVPGLLEDALKKILERRKEK